MNDKKTLTTRMITLPRILLLAIIIVLCFVPQYFGRVQVTMVSRIMIFAVYAMAYDILRGYIGVIHLGFALFIGGGAYFVAILFLQFGYGYPMLLLAVIAVCIYAVIWALIAGKIAGKSGLLATAMITMAFAEIVRMLMERWRSVTNGTDGITFRVPEPLNDWQFMFYLSLVFLIAMAIVLHLFVNSPTGRVWQAVRENEQRAIFLGYNTNKVRTIALIVAGIVAGLAGIMFGLLTRFVNPDTIGMQYTYNAMLYSMLGGEGTLFGAILGSTIVILFQNLLLDLRSFHFIFERWPLFFGALYIIVVMFMPQGIFGYYLSWKEKRGHKKQISADTKGEN
jgi:branched-chain amino acid transport system permease protein